VQTMDFTPSASGSISLTFQDIYTTNGTSSNASLDNVDLIAITPEIPSGLIAASFCAMVILSRKRKQLLIATIEQ